MPSQKEHKAQALHNENFFSDLESYSNYNDWVITGIFYSALHYIDSYFGGLSKPKHPNSHKDRTRFIQGDSTTMLIMKNYRKLKDYSMNARYKLIQINPQDIKDAKSQLNDIKSTIL